MADLARVVMREGTARLAGWDLTADDDDVWGLGLGCNGAIEVFIEPAEQAAAPEMRAAFSGGKQKTARQAELEQQWAAFAKDNYAKAKAKADEALKLVR